MSTGGPCHHYGEGAPLKQINTRACGQYCQKELAGDLEAGGIIEHVLSEVMAFLEMSGTVKKSLQTETIPPDRSVELEKLRKEIENIELELQELQGAVPQPSMATPKEIKKASKCAVEEKIGTVPEWNNMARKT